MQSWAAELAASSTIMELAGTTFESLKVPKYSIRKSQQQYLFPEIIVENDDVTLHYSAIFTHGADAMTPCQSGLVSQARGFNSIILASPLLVHSQALGSRTPW